MSLALDSAMSPVPATTAPAPRVTLAPRVPLLPQAPVAGVILAGGRSRRMGTDKAGITVNGESAVRRLFRLLRLHLETVVVSVRAEQMPGPAFAGLPCVADSGAGPLGGIVAAHLRYPDSALLVVAVDLVGIDSATIASLLAARNEGFQVAGCRSPGRDEMHPLCAVWEPGLLAQARAAWEAGERSPRRVLERAPARLLVQTTDVFVDANTREQLEGVMR